MPFFLKELISDLEILYTLVNALVDLGCTFVCLRGKSIKGHQIRLTKFRINFTQDFKLILDLA
jgi:hypothetical protein